MATQTQHKEVNAENTWRDETVKQQEGRIKDERKKGEREGRTQE